MDSKSTGMPGHVEDAILWESAATFVQVVGIDQLAAEDLAACVLWII